MSKNYKSFFIKFFSANFIVRSVSLLKDLMLGWIIGPTKILDVFFFLISVPMVLTSTWNKALETVFVSTYEKDKHSQGREFASGQFSLHIYNFTLISFLIYLAVSAALPLLIYNFYPEFTASNILYIVFIVNMAFVIETYILGIKVLCYSDQRFFLPSILPVFQSVMIILGLLVMDKMTLLILSILFALGALMQFSFFLRKEFRFFFTKIKFGWDGKAIRLLIKNVAQLSLASGLSSLNLIIDQSFALSLGEGANSYIHYGNYFLLIFTFLIVNNISTIFFPQFQKYVLNNEKNKLESDVRKVTRIILTMNVFIVVLILNNGYFFLDLLLGYGKISQSDLVMIYFCSVGYIGAFLGLALNAILVRILHVYNNYNIIVIVAALNSGFNIILNFVFVHLFGVWGIALSTSVTLLVLIAVYIIYLQRKYKLNIFRENNDRWMYRFLIVFFLIGIFEFILIRSADRLLDVNLMWNMAVLALSFIVITGMFHIFKVARIKNFRIVI